MDLVSCKVSLTLVEVLFDSSIVMASSLARVKDVVPMILFIGSTHTNPSQLDFFDWGWWVHWCIINIDCQSFSFISGVASLPVSLDNTLTKSLQEHMHYSTANGLGKCSYGVTCFTSLRRKPFSYFASILFFSFHFSFFKELCIGNYLFHQAKEGSRLIKRRIDFPFKEGCLYTTLTYL